MLKTIKIPIFALTAALLFIGSNVWADQDRHGDGRSHGRHDIHRHANPDLTLVSGMDNIDSRVLVDPAPDPDPAVEVIDQTVPETATIPSQQVISDVDGDFVVNVPNNAGGYTSIRIQRFGNGYVGPQGEFYYPFPQVTQLKAMYGI